MLSELRDHGIGPFCGLFRPFLRRAFLESDVAAGHHGEIGLDEIAVDLGFVFSGGVIRGDLFDFCVDQGFVGFEFGLVEFEALAIDGLFGLVRADHFREFGFFEFVPAIRFLASAFEVGEFDFEPARIGFCAEFRRFRADRVGVDLLREQFGRFRLVLCAGLRQFRLSLPERRFCADLRRKLARALRDVFGLSFGFAKLRFFHAAFLLEFGLLQRALAHQFRGDGHALIAAE